MSLRPLLLVTGGAGSVASRLRPLLREHYRLRLVDMQPPHNTAEKDEAIVADLLSPDDTAAAVDGVDAIIHLAGTRSPRADWATLESVNVRMSQQLFAIASRAGVKRLIYASSVHASGGYVRDDAVPVDPAWPTRPCCLYGASKVAVEALGAVYANTTELAVICLRLGLASSQPDRPSALASWVSPHDLAQLTHMSIASKQKCGVYFAVSANTRSVWNIDSAQRELSYQPTDNAEDHAHVIDAPDAPGSPCFDALAAAT